jgi:hypothetical protein
LSYIARYVTYIETTKSVKKALNKYGYVDILHEKVKGSVKVIGYRKYSWGDEIDIEFTGKIYARVSWGKLEWFGHSILDNKNNIVSKVKVNRFIKRCCLRDIRIHMNYFGIRIDQYSQIKKIKWS